MKLYFYSPQNNADSQLAMSALKQAGVSLSSNLLPARNLPKGKEESLTKVDGLLVLAKNFDPQAAYLIALTLSQNRPVLCLLPKGQAPDKTLQSLQAQPNFAKKLRIDFYEPAQIKAPVIVWLQSLDQDSLRNLFNIKYTLRLSAKISDYLNWKAKQTSMTGADWLRQQIQDAMDKDSDYQQVLKNKFKVK
ncbi:MAG: hypothetical protein WC465_05210 [Patescibacteria group bacterium]